MKYPDIPIKQPTKDMIIITPPIQRLINHKLRKLKRVRTLFIKNVIVNHQETAPMIIESIAEELDSGNRSRFGEQRN